MKLVVAVLRIDGCGIDYLTDQAVMFEDQVVKNDAALPDSMQTIFVKAPSWVGQDMEPLEQDSKTPLNVFAEGFLALSIVCPLCRHRVR